MRLVRDPFERPRLGAAAAGAVAHEVERDRIQPRLLARLALVEAVARPQGTLEGVGQEVLGERRVAGAIGEKSEEWLSVLLVEPLEIIPPHH